MKHQTVGFLALIFFAISGCQPQPVQFTTEDEATLRGMVEATARDFGAGDMETWSQQYANDAVFQPPNAPMVVGQANILALGQAFPPLEKLTFSNITVSGEGNIGYGTSSYDMAFADKTTDQGKQLVVFRRPPSGAWEIVAVSFNSDLPAQ
jgi:ketosteroid isomerase-like protein